MGQEIIKLKGLKVNFVYICYQKQDPDIGFSTPNSILRNHRIYEIREFKGFLYTSS